MKYKLNGEWIDVNIKALDSMPVGAIVEYDGQVSDIPNGWQTVSGKSYTAHELYNSSTGSTGNIQLSETSANFDYIEIYGEKAGCYGYSKVYNPNGKQVGIAIHNVYDTGAIQQIFARYSISGSSITKDNELYMLGNGQPTTSNDLSIKRVVGYKEV